MVLHTINSGLNWTVIQSNTSNNLKKIQFSDSLKGLIIGNDGIILKTINGGNSWIRIALQYNNDLNDLYFVSKDTIYISGNSGMILCSIDGGSTWKKQNTSITDNLKSIAFWNNNRGMASGENGRLLLTSLGEKYHNGENDRNNLSPSHDNKNSNPINFELLQNYPNPFNPETEIKYTIPENSNVSLIVYDLTGQVVGELVKGYKHSGTYAAIFNASNLASGVYFYKLIVYNGYSSNERYTLTKKMILVK